MAKEKKEKKRKESVSKKKETKDQKKECKSKSSNSSSKRPKQSASKTIKSLKNDKKTAAAAKKGKKRKDASANVIAITETTVAKNQEQIDMIVSLLGAVRPECITRHSKDDLDAIQKLVTNIALRDAGEESAGQRVVSFTEAQTAVIKHICKVQDVSDKRNGSIESEISVTAFITRLTCPFVRLNLVPTCLSKKNQPKK